MTTRTWQILGVMMMTLAYSSWFFVDYFSFQTVVVLSLTLLLVGIVMVFYVAYKPWVYEPVSGVIRGRE